MKRRQHSLHLQYASIFRHYSDVGYRVRQSCGGTGAHTIADYLKERGIRFSLILDEGGCLKRNLIPDCNSRSDIIINNFPDNHKAKRKRQLPAALKITSFRRPCPGLQELPALELGYLLQRTLS